MLLTKIIFSILIVIILSVVAERISPKYSGILSGYPLGAAVALFFYGLEVSPEFASQSAVYTLLGLISAQAFCYVYYLVSVRIDKFNILISSIAAIFAFLLVAYILNCFELSKYIILVLTLLSVVLFMFLFKEIPNLVIKNQATLGCKTILIRALLATVIIVCITSSPEVVGERWSGYFSGFPITLFPLILIIHFSYQKEHVHTIIKHFPRGLGALIIYACSVHYLYPIYGIYIGTVVSFVFATLYLMFILRIIKEREVSNK